MEDHIRRLLATLAALSTLLAVSIAAAGHAERTIAIRRGDKAARCRARRIPSATTGFTRRFRRWPRYRQATS